MTERGFEVIVCSTNSRKLRRVSIMKNTEGGHVNMCKAFDEWMEDCRMEGKALGIRIGEERGQKRGEKRGEKRGVKKGEARLSQLILKLGAGGKGCGYPACGGGCLPQKPSLQKIWPVRRFLREDRGREATARQV